ncbi:putative nucleotidyltransferase substrate binding domain-containing protein [Plantactinospora sp. WMMB334]|uniref:putative nucleotidyltransferase substrate binding domain-containing protein n=1 Tax=Plantactinospora sp. WMMB334 TaxID=3404119 RepID=UPI003B92F3DA
MKEFADFLGEQPPFDALDPDDLARLVTRVEVEYFAAGATVVPKDEPLTHLWVVRTGALEVVDRGRVVDLLGPGDTYGHVWLLSGLPPPVRLRAHEESLCLRIPDPRGFLSRPDRLRYAAVRPGTGRQHVVGAGPGRAGQPLTRLSRPVVWCDGADRVRDVADRIGANGSSCALVRTTAGLGIVTDLDFRRGVATGRVGVDAPVADLASVPVLTVREDATQAAGLLRMVEHGVHHLVVVDRDGRPSGVVRAVDLAQVEVRDPLLVRSAVDDADDLDQLAEACGLLPGALVELAGNGVAAVHIGAVHAAVVDAVVRRVLRLHHGPVLDGVRHSWVLLGSLARREPLPLSDIDTALVWADPDDPATPEPDRAERFRAGAREVLRDLQRCGLTLCANGVNAHNPLFSRSRSEWIAAARDWQGDPTQEKALLLSAMVADSRPLTEPALGQALTAGIRSHTRTSQFLRAVLDEALAWRPPNGFVRDFVVAHTGEHRGQLDLKAGGLTPIVALARWIAIAAGDATGGTVDRLHRGAALGLLSTDEAETLAGGFESIYGLLIQHEIAAIRDGRTPTTYLAPKELDSLTRRHLRETFRSVALVQAGVDRNWRYRLPERAR